MIDTVVLSYTYSLEEELLSSWTEEFKRMQRGGFIHRFTLNHQCANGAPLRLTYYPRNYKGIPQLDLEVSLPYLLNGSNLELFQSLEQGIIQANAILNSEPSFLPILNVRNGVLTRLDIYYNHFVGTLIPYFLHALHDLQFPHRKTIAYLKEGVQFKSRNVTTKFYDKEQQCGLPEAWGILRQEVTLRTKALYKLTGKKRPMLTYLTPTMLYDALESDLDKLGLLGQSIATYDLALSKLCECHGAYGGMFLYGILHAKVEHRDKLLIARLTGYKVRSIECRLRELLDAGMPITWTDATEPLPPLNIDHKRWPKDDDDENMLEGEE